MYIIAPLSCHIHCKIARKCASTPLSQSVTNSDAKTRKMATKAAHYNYHGEIGLFKGGKIKTGMNFFLIETGTGACLHYVFTSCSACDKMKRAWGPFCMRPRSDALDCRCLRTTYI